MKRHLLLLLTLFTALVISGCASSSRGASYQSKATIKSSNLSLLPAAASTTTLAIISTTTSTVPLTTPEPTKTCVRILDKMNGFAMKQYNCYQDQYVGMTDYLDQQLSSIALLDSEGYTSTNSELHALERQLVFTARDLATAVWPASTESDVKALAVSMTALSVTLRTIDILDVSAYVNALATSIGDAQLVRADLNLPSVPTYQDGLSGF